MQIHIQSRVLADKRNQYGEFAVPTLLLANSFMLDVGIIFHTLAQAFADMQGLEGLK